MKTLRQIVELKKIDLVPDPELQAGQISNYANPKSDAERRFVDKHLDTVQQALHPAFKTEAEQDAVFKGGNIKRDETHHSAGAGHYKDGEDADIYEQALLFVRENLTEENLKEFDALVESDPDTAVDFAMDVASEVLGDE